MTLSVHSIQTAETTNQTEQSVQPPKTLQKEASTENPASRDQVTISREARQSLAQHKK